MNSHNSKYNPHKKHLSQAILLRYKEGILSDAEMHKVEIHLLDCELCKDAYEGVLLIENKEYSADLSKIKASFQHRFPRKTHPVPQWKGLAVASVAIFILITIGIMINNRFVERNELAQKELNTKNKIIVDSEPVIAENIQDTIINHHIALNDPVISKQISEKVISVKPTPPLEKKENINKIVSSKNEKDIIVMAESLPEIKEEVIFEDREVVENFEKVQPSQASRLDNSLSGRAAGVQLERERITKAISGKVIDDEGKPLPGVNIMVKGTTKGVISDIDGKYELMVAPDDKVLVYSFIGFSNEEVGITEQNTLTVTMQPDIRALSEVVVVGYGTRSSESEIQNSVKINPKPINGMRKFRQYIKENQRYPEAAFLENVEGNVTLQFNVNQNGAITEIFVIKPLGYGLDDEAIRLVKEGPAWKPATVNGKPVNEIITLKIPFKIRKK